MRYKKINPKLGDVIGISDQMSLRFEMIADDLAPMWVAIPPGPSTADFEVGSFVNVTEDVWFVYDKTGWRVMSNNEHSEAKRQKYFNDVQM